MDSPRGPQTQHAPKAEKTDLEMFLRVSGPELLKKHAANAVLGVMLIVAATMFLYTRHRNKLATQSYHNQNTAIAYDLATEARLLFSLPYSGDSLLDARQQKVREIFTRADEVSASNAGPSQKAAALLAKAEVLWLMANAPAQSATATTQSVLGFTQRKPAEYLNDAEATYTEILTKFPNEKEYAANALISLGTIAESRRNFDEARKRYQQVADDASLRTTYREIAKGKIEWLKTNSRPYLLATPATLPTTLPSVSTSLLEPPLFTAADLFPTTQPTPAVDAPSGEPADPTTVPAP